MVERHFHRFEGPKVIRFLRVSFTRLLRPSTTPPEIRFLARNQFSNRGRCLCSMRATFFIGSMRERKAPLHQRPKNFPVQGGER